MKVVVSPAKKLDFETECAANEQTEPYFLEKTNLLAKELKKLQAVDIAKLMKLSPALSELNYQRFQSFSKLAKPSTSKQAAFAFNGDTYTGLDIQSFSKSNLKTAQSKLRILSGLYGILKPFDLIQPYRLEMGTKFKFAQNKNLYDFWKEEITGFLNRDLKKDEVLVNCASQEYFKAVDITKLNATVITPVFKELRNGELKIISFSAKKARGMMAKFIIKNNLKNPEELKNFNEEEYKFSKQYSTETEYVFVR